MIKQCVCQFTAKYVRDKSNQKKERIEEVESRISLMNNQLLTLSGTQYDNVKKQIAEMTQQLSIIHKRIGRTIILEDFTTIMNNLQSYSLIMLHRFFWFFEE